MVGIVVNMGGRKYDLSSESRETLAALHIAAKSAHAELKTRKAKNPRDKAIKAALASAAEAIVKIESEQQRRKAAHMGSLREAFMRRAQEVLEQEKFREILDLASHDSGGLDEWGD